MITNHLKLICKNLWYFSKKKNLMSKCTFQNTRFFKWVRFFFFQADSIPEYPTSICMFSWKLSSVIISLHDDKWFTDSYYIQYEDKENSFHSYTAHAHKCTTTQSIFTEPTGHIVYPLHTTCPWSHIWITELSLSEKD